MGAPTVTRVHVRAITVKQPYAELIIAGAKTVENRSWQIKHRGLLAIHAGRDRRVLRSLGLKPHRFVLGAVIGLVELVDIVEDHTSPWATDERYHWVLVNPRRLLEPVVLRGEMGLFTVELPYDDVGLPATGLFAD